MSKSPSPRSRAKRASLDPKVFVKAAEIVAIERADFACIALLIVGGNHVSYFIDVLRPRNDGEHDSCEGRDFYLAASEDENTPWYGCDEDASNRDARVLGLLLCAELVKDGFKPTPYKRT